MAVETTRIIGKVLVPSGSPASGGKIRARLSSPGSVADAGTTQRVGGASTSNIGVDGSVDFKLIPNDAITPSGSIYAIEYQMPGGDSWTEHWNLATTPDPIDIGNIPRVNP